MTLMDTDTPPTVELGTVHLDEVPPVMQVAKLFEKRPCLRDWRAKTLERRFERLMSERRR